MWKINAVAYSADFFTILAAFRRLFDTGLPARRRVVRDSLPRVPSALDGSQVPLDEAGSGSNQGDQPLATVEAAGHIELQKRRAHAGRRCA